MSMKSSCSMNSKMKRVKEYICDDRPNRLKSFARKHRLDLAAMKLRKDRNLLHYCCLHGSGTMLKFLLNEGLHGLDQDQKLNCPLHYALKRAITLEEKGEYDATSTCYTSIILILIQSFPEALDINNADGNTCRKLLQDLVHLRGQNDGISDEDSSTSSTEMMNEKAWRDKLADEYMHEYHTTWGTYEPDYTWDKSQNETYNDWAERIREEYRAKKRAQAHLFHSDRGSKSKESKSQTSSSKLEDARTRMREQFDRHKINDSTVKILQKRMKYEERYKTVMDNNLKCAGMLKYVEIPWPSLQGEHNDLNVLFDGMDNTGSEYKKYLRDQQIRWHPDKFMQRFGELVSQSDKEKVLARVTALSQKLNTLTK